MEQQKLLGKCLTNQKTTLYIAHAQIEWEQKLYACSKSATGVNLIFLVNDDCFGVMTRQMQIGG